MERAILAVLVCALLLACGKSPRPVPDDPSFTADVQPVFNSHCISCHGATNPSGDYSLTSRTGALGSGSDSVPNVIPGSADSSKLYLRMTGAETPLMPAGGPALDSIKTGTVRNWVNKGARDN
uniref:Cytochrome C Planctomycete-type domain-containing protein n=1 Tax=candidate division WOR-3 bacterium TaxID=2052148 RepID=A0A7C4CD82_UNCW3